jgi:predicted RNA binding protein YcfA (HicA-like mRNA interferase family)
VPPVQATTLCLRRGLTLFYPNVDCVAEPKFILKRRSIKRQLLFDVHNLGGSHERWRHADGRATTIPIHGGREIGPPLFYRILEQLGIDLVTFDRLR